MASTTLLQISMNSDFYTALISGVIAAVVALIGQYYFFQKNRNEEQYRRLYGPVIYHLLMMKTLTSNREELTKEIVNTWRDIDMKNKELVKNLNPLITQWIGHKDSLELLFKDFSGYIRRKDLRLVEDFLDGCIKRNIITSENGGTNFYATKEERINKLLEAIIKLQNKLIP